MKSNFVLLTCVMALTGMLIYVSDFAMKFAAAASNIHCAQSLDYEKCKTNFKQAINETIDSLEN